MSAADNQLPKSSAQSAEQPTSGAAQRPTLVQPPKRPVKPVAEPTSPAPAKKPADAIAPPVATPAEITEELSPALAKTQPISPPSEPMQYRAIGLVRGTYQPQEEQLNRGKLTTEDGTEIDAVLLGRITSLVKKHLDLEASHLWVVYPRTRQDEKDGSFDLHLQIVGVWEPETLGLPGEEPANSEASEAGDEHPDELEPVADQTSPTEAGSDIPDNYFSVRGEVIKADEEDGHVIIKILQGVKRNPEAQKSFRVHVTGKITGKTVGYFWEMDVERQDKLLVLREGRPIGVVPPKKKKPRKGGMGNRRPQGGPRRRSDNAPPVKSKPRIRPTSPVRSNPL